MGRRFLAACCLYVSQLLVAETLPTVFWVSDPVRPDDTVLITGEDFGDHPRLHLLALKPTTATAAKASCEGPVWPGGSMGRVIEPAQATTHSLKAVIPAAESAGAWLGRIENRGNGSLSAPFRINGPTVYWLQGDQGLRRASPGGWLRLFGRCLADLGGTARVLLVARDAGMSALLWKPISSSLWDMRVAVPESVSAGTYRVWVHNGLGGSRAWVEAGTVEIQAPESWPSRVWNVRDLGASGEGDWNDLAALQAALAEAEKSGGGIVYLPRGRYWFEGTLVLPRRTILRGESRALTSLCWPDTDEPYTLIQGSDHFAVENLTLYASNYRHGIAGDLQTPTAGHTRIVNVCLRADMYRGHLKPEQVDARFRTSLKLSTGGGDSLRLGGENVVVKGCDIYGSGRAFYLFGVRGGVIRDNRFYNGRWGWYCITGPDGLIYENNVLTGADLMSTGGGINCLGSIYSRNVYYAGNTIARCHGWDREAMTSDAGGGPYHGKVAGVDGVVLRLPEKPPWQGAARWRGAAVFILGGRGMGQYRRIESVSDDGMSVVLEHPWDIEPDSSSIITITMLQEHYLFAGNHFEDAGIALQYYGTSVDHVAWRNTSIRAGGFYNSGRWYHGYQPSWYCQFLDNEILEGNCYRFGPDNSTTSGPSFLGTYGLQRGDNTAPLAYAAVHRGNHLYNNALIRLLGGGTESPGLCDVVVEHNIVENSAVGLQVGTGCEGVFRRANVFRHVDSIFYDPSAARRRRMKRRQALIKEKKPVFIQDFEHHRGNLLPDASGHGFTAFETGGRLTFEPGVAGQCGRFDGKTFLRVGDRALLRFPRLTLSAWILPDSIKGRWGVMAKRDHNTTCAYVLAIRDGGLGFEATDTKGKWSYNVYAKPSMQHGVWHHVAATCAEGEQVQLYCDGKLVGAKKVSGDIIDNDLPLTIGFEAWGGPDSRPGGSGMFRGCIDEVKIWSRVLQEDEIRREYEQLVGQARADAERRIREKRERDEEQRRRAEHFKHPPGDRWKLVAGQCGRFDGKTFLRVGDRALLRFPRLTLSAWILPDSIKGRWGVMAKRDHNTTCAYVLAIRDGGLGFEATDTKGKWSYNVYAKPSMQHGVWHHVAATCAEGEQVQLYCDGKLVGAKKVSGDIIDNDLPLTIGFEAWGGPDSRPGGSGMFRGCIDEVKIWSRVLQEDEIRREYEQLVGQARADAERRIREKRERDEEQRRRAEHFKHPPGDRWKLVAEDDFSGSAMSDRWVTLRGAWRQQGGVLSCREVSFLVPAKKLSPPLRVEFDARSAHPSDMSAFTGTRKDAYKAGYFVGFASNGNTRNKILRLGQEVTAGDAPLATPGTWYHIICEIMADGRVDLAVDGVPVLHFQDENPLTDTDTAGILAWGEAEFDNLRLYESSR